MHQSAEMPEAGDPPGSQNEREEILAEIEQAYRLFFNLNVASCVLVLKRESNATEIEGSMQMQWTLPAPSPSDPDNGPPTLRTT